MSWAQVEFGAVSESGELRRNYSKQQTYLNFKYIWSKLQWVFKFMIFE